MEKPGSAEIADFHTYFVGCDEWGFSVWAHNADYEIIRVPGSKKYTLYEKATGQPALGAKSGAVIEGSSAQSVRRAAGKEGIKSSNISKLPDYLKERFRAGKEFDKVEGPQYPYNQVEVQVNGKKYVLDSYDSVGREIVSRKGAQLAGIQPESAVRYLNEFLQKYPVGAKITGRQLNAAAIRNQRLAGDLILEVPVQAKPVPKAVLDAAAERGITIRDIKGTVYGG